MKWSQMAEYKVQATAAKRPKQRQAKPTQPSQNLTGLLDGTERNAVERPEDIGNKKLI